MKRKPSKPKREVMPPVPRNAHYGLPTHYGLPMRSMSEPVVSGGRIRRNTRKPKRKPRRIYTALCKCAPGTVWRGLVWFTRGYALEDASRHRWDFPEHTPHVVTFEEVLPQRAR